MYAEKITKAIQKTLDETERRRKIQEEFNRKHGVSPKSAVRKKAESLEETFGISKAFEEENVNLLYKTTKENISDLEAKIRECKTKMKIAAQKLQFEEAAHWRDELRLLENLEMLKS